MIRWARTGPTPGRASNWGAVAVLRLSGVVGGWALSGVPVEVVGWVGRPTTICSPSVSWRARLRELRSTPRRGPPARVRASATREPVGARIRPGRWTLPATWTTRVVVGLAVAFAD